MTLAERLLAGEHYGCDSWAAVAAKLGVSDRQLRAVRKIYADRKRPFELRPSSNIGKTDNSASEPHVYAFGDVTKAASEPTYSNAAGYGVDEAKMREAFGALDKSYTSSDRLRPNSWPNVAEFDRTPLHHFEAADFRNEQAVIAAQQPYEPPPQSNTKHLTRADCPDGTLILWASDIHIPIHNELACRLMVECAERSGVRRVVAGGDILDMNCLSKHAKESKRTVEHATILEEVEPGRWLLDWFATKQTDLILGNHEDRLKRFVDENPAFHGSLVSNFAKVTELPVGINVLPQGGEVRLGNLVMSHGDAEFKNSSGGMHPAAKLLSMAPDQSSIIGHLHRMAIACRTSRDEDGICRTRRAWTMGHMSIEEMHYGYVKKNPNWQTGFAMIRVYWEGGRPRWTVYPIEVLFDRFNRPYFEFEGYVHRAARTVAA